MYQKLGQHFLINKSALEKIAAALDIQPNDTIIEIGPGHGELTLLLAKNFQFLISNFKLIAIEKDALFTEELQNKFTNNKNIKIINGDVLKNLPAIIKNPKLKIKNYKITGNIPYYITGKLLRTLSELKNKPSLIILTIQKEVAERICAAAPKMNLLAAATQFWSEPEILFNLKQEDFNPPPKIESAVIKLTPRRLTGDGELYYKLIHAVFKQPRKTIVNNLWETIKIPKNETLQILKKLGMEPNDRPQNLSVGQLVRLGELIKW
ncbi:MAG: 16S rRNA (adenine1518-N6/adenine1519-N6)-dimethyltransferase [Parcubacteria group bacterium Athens0714_26]|nr:MAG: 16S rRNA (adenine1518-N6/adenine1519-N6)-dimethyltransferase [Parcubacteria group bacterium Athens1014_26]TSD02287.1 MAG: 16S rRNA (adenine1518-N6/adenine1519-N6)-dimethyltransferase [Parcubacteria group bacterium Athens0714_26]